MISISLKDNLVSVAVFGEFAIADYKEFEEAVLFGLKFQGTVNVLIDLRDMLGFTVDVAWEELKFSRRHAQDFGKIAVVTDDQWITWSAWLSRAFVDANVQVFADYDAAQGWVTG
jgi:hypothetical protein